ncbi:trypsin-like peptidase domain-containing protein [Roseibium sp. MMSF_3544]|uniref:trypsin-like peptidase domain-containing protein n=1 Tax=unclassified Roseibium TaxID=2629323 RepID=UPI00273DC9E5|nr:trypsin-like peptidase domain-containing protein [Roseibium sp. MMSF_3544]
MSFWSTLSVLKISFVGFCLLSASAFATPRDALQHVVSVLPVWPGHQQGGTGSRPGTAPEGSGVILREGVIATAWHVVEPARRIDIRLHDGRILPARILAHDEASDIALLEVAERLAAIDLAPPPEVAQPACAIGNAFGLGLSVTCGVVSATGVSNAGFNAVEDFVQTDAAANPGSSGGALVDANGRLIGMVSAIFASDADANIGVNFAVSADLLLRVADALIANGKVDYPAPGWALGAADRRQLETLAAPKVDAIRAGGPADVAGFETGDLILEIGARTVRTPRDAVAALALIPDAQTQIRVKYQRDGREQVAMLSFETPPATLPSPAGSRATAVDPDCPHPAEICQVRQAVFPISSFDPVGSATRIAKDLLVTNRHVVGNLQEATVYTPDGPRQAELVPSAYRGDLVLLKVDGLPDTGVIPALDGSALSAEPYFVVGADVARQQVRVFDPGLLIAKPAENAEFGRLHVRAQMQPGVSGGALVSASGGLAGIAVGGGEGRFEAIPIADVRKLLAMREDDDASRVTQDLGASFAECAQAIEASSAQNAAPSSRLELSDSCARSSNHGQLLNAGRVLARAGDFENAIRLHGQAAGKVPNSINTRMTLLVSLQLAGRFEDMTEHARWLMQAAPDDPQALRFSIQSGVWGGDPDLAEAGYQALLNADPRQAQAARRFIDAAPPRPPRR